MASKQINEKLLIDGWEEDKLDRHLKKQPYRKDLKIRGSHRGFNFLQTQKLFEGYLPDDNF